MPVLWLSVARSADVLAGGDAGLDAPPPEFGAAELARWQALAAPHREAFAASRRLLRRLLARATGVAPALWAVSADVGRAPVAQRRDDTSEAAPAVSLSHRLGWVVAAVADAGLGPIGVDLECDRPPRSPAPERAALMLSPAELAAWHDLPEARREAALLQAWVAKEAWYKASAPGAAAWDFRRVEARDGDPARANVHVWRAPPLSVALCCAVPAALRAATCEGLPATDDPQAGRHVLRVA